MQQIPERKRIDLYAEGVCHEEPGPGAWACVLEFSGHRKELTDHMSGTTAARMELFALISGIGALKQPCDVMVYSTSAALKETFAGITAPADPGLWRILKLQCKKQQHRVRYTYVQDLKNAPQTMHCRELAEASIGEYRRLNALDEKTES